MVENEQPINTLNNPIKAPIDHPECFKTSSHLSSKYFNFNFYITYKLYPNLQYLKRFNFLINCMQLHHLKQIHSNDKPIFLKSMKSIILILVHKPLLFLVF